ncbi:MAG: hypothetical protein AB7O97_02225 [Planctomycetota bacterium]
MSPLAVFLIAVFVAFAAWMCARSFDIGRIDGYLRSRGGRLIAHTWRPFGKGWFGEGSERIYDIRFRDRDGQEHQATAKTSMLTGVYLTDDRPVRTGAVVAAPAAATATDVALPEVEALRRENERLRAELEQLRQGG